MCIQRRRASPVNLFVRRIGGVVLMLAGEIRDRRPEAIPMEPQLEELILAVTRVKPATRICTVAANHAAW